MCTLCLACPGALAPRSFCSPSDSPIRSLSLGLTSFPFLSVSLAFSGVTSVCSLFIAHHGWYSILFASHFPFMPCLSRLHACPSRGLFLCASPVICWGFSSDLFFLLCILGFSCSFSLALCCPNFFWRFFSFAFLIASLGFVWVAGLFILFRFWFCFVISLRLKVAILAERDNLKKKKKMVTWP